MRTVKELREWIKDIPDDYEISFSTGEDIRAYLPDTFADPVAWMDNYDSAEDRMIPRRSE